MTHPQDLSLVEQASAIRCGNLDADELLENTLERIAERDRVINSTPVTFEAASRKMLDAAPDGPLHGVPVTMKDMFSMPWRGAHNATPFELIAPCASGPFRRLRDAGAVIVGVANQDELGMGTTGTASVYGATANPWNTAHCAGGSSGGSAAAVAARLVAASIGSDSSGSTRLPAAYCGVVGMKLTYRSLPYDGYFGASTTFSAPGVVARDSADARLLAEVMLDRALRESDGRALRVGIVHGPVWDDVDPEVVSACSLALDETGWIIKDVVVDHQELTVAANMGRLIAEVGIPPSNVLASLAPPTRAILLAGQLLPARYVTSADRVRAALRRSVASVFETVDVLAWPTTPAPAPQLHDTFFTLPSGRASSDMANLRQASLANITGLPGVSIPVGLHSNGLPIGLQLLAPWGAEARLLDAAEHIECVSQHEHVRLTPLLARPG